MKLFNLFFTVMMLVTLLSCGKIGEITVTEDENEINSSFNNQIIKDNIQRNDRFMDDENENTPNIIDLCKSAFDSAQFSPGFPASRITIADSVSKYFIIEVRKSETSYYYYRVQKNKPNWVRYDFFEANNGNRNSFSWHRSTTGWYKTGRAENGDTYIYFDNGTLDTHDDTNDENLIISVQGRYNTVNSTDWSEPIGPVTPANSLFCDQSINNRHGDEGLYISHIKIRIKTGDAFGSSNGGIDVENRDKLTFHFGLVDAWDNGYYNDYFGSCNLGNYYSMTGGSLSENQTTDIVWSVGDCYIVQFPGELREDDFKYMYLSTDNETDKIMIKSFSVYIKYNAENTYTNIYKNEYVYQTLEKETYDYATPFDWSSKDEGLFFEIGDYAIKFEFEVKNQNQAGTSSQIDYRWVGRYWVELDNIRDDGFNIDDFRRGESSFFRHYVNTYSYGNSIFDYLELYNRGNDRLKLEGVKIWVKQCYGRDKKQFYYRYANDISLRNSTFSIPVPQNWTDY